MLTLTPWVSPDVLFKLTLLLSFSVPDLAPGVDYTFEVIPFNKNIVGSSASVSARTDGKYYKYLHNFKTFSPCYFSSNSGLYIQKLHNNLLFIYFPTLFPNTRFVYKIVPILHQKFCSHTDLQNTIRLSTITDNQLHITWKTLAYHKLKTSEPDWHTFFVHRRSAAPDLWHLHRAVEGARHLSEDRLDPVPRLPQGLLGVWRLLR